MTTEDTWEYPFDDIAEQDREQEELRQLLDAIGAANTWLRLAMRTRKVALLVFRGFTVETCDTWFAHWYAKDSDVPVEFTGQTWRIALTNAVLELLPDPICARFLASKDAWFLDAWHPDGYPLSEVE